VIDATLVRPGADAAPAARPEPVRSSRVAIRWLVVTLIGASAAFLCVLLAHPMWFDEMQAWNIARSSGSLADLVGNLRYEGHPVGWYLLLYGITRVTGDPRAMQALDFVIVVGTFALVLFRSPFPYPFRLGLVASYFVFFEYGSISRSYGLAVLLLVAILCQLDADSPRWGVLTVLSCALAFSVLSGAVLALALAAAVLWTRPAERGRRVYALVTGVAVTISAVSCIPPPDFRTFAQGLGNTSQFGSGPVVRALSSLAGFWRAAVPLPDGSRAWNTNVLDSATGALALQAIAGILVFVVVLRVLAGSPMARRLWCIGSVGCVAFSLIVILPERYRYAGTAFLLLVACAWLAWRTTVPRQPLTIVFGVVLVLQLLATIALIPSGMGDRFSPDHDFAEVIERDAPNATIVSGADYDALTTAGYLDQPVYSVARGAWTRYFVHDARQARGAANLRQSQVLCAASSLAERSRRPVVTFVTSSSVPGGVRQLTEARGVRVLLVGPSAAGRTCSG
jgi:hypothetical protein